MSQQDQNMTTSAARTEPLAVVGLVAALLVWPAGLILSIVALRKIGRERTGGRGLAVAGVVVSVIGAVVTTVLVVVLVWLSAVVVQGSTVNPGVPTDPATVAADENATAFVVEPASAVPAGEIDGIVALLKDRLHDSGARVRPESGAITVEFAEPPQPEVVQLLTAPSRPEFRPVLAVGDPEPVKIDDETADASPSASHAASDPASLLTEDTIRAFAAIDCTAPQQPVLLDHGGAVMCDRSGTAKYAVGPAELSGAGVDSVEEAEDGAVITLALDATAALREVTARLSELVSPQNQIAIVVDGFVAAAPAVQQTITDGTVYISGETQGSAELYARLTFGAPHNEWTVRTAAAAH